MAEKKVSGFVKLQIPAGAANPADDGPIEADYEVVDDKNEGK